MTTLTQPRPAAQATAQPRSSGPRIAAIVAGVVLALGGAGTAMTGGGLLAVFGGDETVNSGRHSLSTSSSALITEVADLKDTSEVGDVLGDPRVRLSVHSTQPSQGLFVGIGPADQVDRYLAAAPVDEISDLDLDPFELTHNPRPGTKRPTAPAGQSFWVAQGTGRDAASLNWKVREGDYRVVVMNADGSRGVHTDGDVGLTVPHMNAIAWSLLVGGLLSLAGGIVAIVLGARRQD